MLPSLIPFRHFVRPSRTPDTRRRIFPAARYSEQRFEVALLNKSGLDKTYPSQSFIQAVRTLSGIPARVILFNARIMAIASPTCAS